MYYLDRAFIASFLARLDTTTVPGCHLWTGQRRGSTGHGIVRTTKPVRFRSAHAVALEIHLQRRLGLGTGSRGRLNANHRDDLCQHRHCCNPDHLYEGTQAANMEDALRANRGGAAFQRRKTHCPRGHAYDMLTSSGGRACRICFSAAQSASGDRRLAGALSNRGRPRTIECTHSPRHLVRRKSGRVACRKCATLVKQAWRLSRQPHSTGPSAPATSAPPSGCHHVRRTSRH